MFSIKTVNEIFSIKLVRDSVVHESSKKINKKCHQSCPSHGFTNIQSYVILLFANIFTNQKGSFIRCALIFKM